MAPVVAAHDTRRSGGGGLGRRARIDRDARNPRPHSRGTEPWPITPGSPCRDSRCHCRSRASFGSPGNWPPGDLVIGFVATMVGCGRVLRAQCAIAGGAPRASNRTKLATVVLAIHRDTAFNNLALAPAWVAHGDRLLDSVVGDPVVRSTPVHDPKASHRLVEMREMFTQTIGALAAAVDKRDPYTARHSERVKEIAVDIGRVMRVSDAELEALEWGGLLHDVGKIGVPDDVLKKPDRLTRDERMIMNSHPVLGAQIICAGHEAGGGAADHPAPPRVVQRLWLPGPADRRRDPEARPDPARRGRLRGDDGRPAVSHDAADPRAGPGRAAQVRRHPVRPGWSSMHSSGRSMRKASPIRAGPAARARSR